MSTAEPTSASGVASAPVTGVAEPASASAGAPKKLTKGQRTRQQIFDAAFELFGESGYQAVSLRDIAARVGITHVTVLHYFSSKDELLSRLMVQRDEIERQAAREFLEADHESHAEYRGLRAPALRWYMHRIQENERERAAIPLFQRISMEAAADDHPVHDHFVWRYRLVKDVLVGAFTEELALRPAGSVEIDPAMAAAQLIALTDGFPFQSVYDTDSAAPSISDVAWEYLRVLGIVGPAADAG